MTTPAMPRHEALVCSVSSKREIVLNLLRLTPEAKIGLPPMTEEEERWIKLWTHILKEEC